MIRILVIGGYGGFGRHVSTRLAALGHELIVAGRSLDRAEAFCREVPGCRPVRVDRRQGILALLATDRPGLVIDASGPFQAIDYRLIEACVAARVAYLDLADAREFVCGVAKFDSAAKRAGVAIVSGASSVPALSGSVVRELARGLERVASVEIAISASSRASAGPAVAAAILGGVGQPVRTWRGQRWETERGWRNLRREHFRIARASPIGPRLGTPADVPDLAILPDRLPGSPAVSFRAGTESQLAMAALSMLSRLVARGWIKSAGAWSRHLVPIHRLLSTWGSDRSAMRVELFGWRGGKRVARSWTLIADRGDGPVIPALAAVILADRIAHGRVPPGARHAGGELELDDFAPAFGTLAVTHAITDLPQPEPLYRRIMQADFDVMAPAVRAIHSVLRDCGADGRAIVVRGANPIARLTGALMRFPPAGETPLHVHFTERDGGERWIRDFGGGCFASHLSSASGLIVERFGPLRFHFALVRDGNGLAMEIRRWSAFGIRLPMAMAPRSRAREWEEEGRFHFDVPIAMPLIGLIVHYRGWLDPPALP